MDDSSRMFDLFISLKNVEICSAFGLTMHAIETFLSLFEFKNCDISIILKEDEKI